MSVTEGRGLAAGEIGLAAINIRQSPTLVLSQFTDNPTYTQLHSFLYQFDTELVLLPNTLHDQTTELYKQIAALRVAIQPVARQYYNDGEGWKNMQNLACEEYRAALDIEVKSKYYSLSAANALIKYVEFTRNIVLSSNSMRIYFWSALSTMMIDPKTASALELLVNNCDPKSDKSLYGILNKTKTRAGMRLLRSNILQPSTDQELIESRLEIIDAIHQNGEMATSLEASTIKSFTF